MVEKSTNISLKYPAKQNRDEHFIILASHANTKFPSGFFKGAYWISSNSSIQYCDSNIGRFSIAPPLVIALTRF